MEVLRERLTAPPSWWLGVAAFSVAWAWLALVIATPAVAVGVGLVVLALTGALLGVYGAVPVRSGPDGLTVGRAHLDAAHLGAVEPLDAAAFRERLGPTADARAWLKTRPYLAGGMLVHVDDPADPAPYWLVSSRRAQAHARVLRETAGARTPTREAPRGQEEA